MKKSERDGLNKSINKAILICSILVKRVKSQNTPEVDLMRELISLSVMLSKIK